MTRRRSLDPHAPDLPDPQEAVRHWDEDHRQEARPDPLRRDAGTEDPTGPGEPADAGSDDPDRFGSDPAEGARGADAPEEPGTTPDDQR